jgi:hypothetical protein
VHEEHAFIRVGCHEAMDFFGLLADLVVGRFGGAELLDLKIAVRIPANQSQALEVPFDRRVGCAL